MIALDLDGTLLDDHKKIRPVTRQVLERAAEQGIEVVPATGRPYRGLCSEAEGLKVDLCLDHHRAGPEAVHNNQEMRELLCRIVQEEYEKSHTREEWMEISRKNYLE